MREYRVDSTGADVERALRALAAVDAREEAPAGMHALVMKAWDRDMSAVPRGRAVVARAAMLAGAASVAAAALLLIADRSRDDGPRGREEPPPAGTIALAEPPLDPAATSVVRVRMPRRALAGLGIPLADPEGGGAVDLEILVGEDGIARTIRRVVPVAASAAQE